jgi:hypothetical protein
MSPFTSILSFRNSWKFLNHNKYNDDCESQFSDHGQRASCCQPKERGKLSTGSPRIERRAGLIPCGHSLLTPTFLSAWHYMGVWPGSWKGRPGVQFMEYERWRKAWDGMNGNGFWHGKCRLDSMTALPLPQLLPSPLQAVSITTVILQKHIQWPNHNFQLLSLLPPSPQPGSDSLSKGAGKVNIWVTKIQDSPSFHILLPSLYSACLWLLIINELANSIIFLFWLYWIQISGDLLPSFWTIRSMLCIPGSQ